MLSSPALVEERTEVLTSPALQIRCRVQSELPTRHPARARLGQQQPPQRQKQALRHQECQYRVWRHSSSAPDLEAPRQLVMAGPAPAGHTPDPSPRQMAEAIEAVAAQ